MVSSKMPTEDVHDLVSGSEITWRLSQQAHFPKVFSFGCGDTLLARARDGALAIALQGSKLNSQNSKGCGEDLPESKIVYSNSLVVAH